MTRAHQHALTQWRHNERAALEQRRAAMTPAQRASRDATITACLHAVLVNAGAATVSLYWPFNGEFDTRPLLRRLDADGVCVALPVVIEARAPLVFCRWRPGEVMVRGVFGVPVPQTRDVVRPEAVVAPLLGFDRAGYRLGYGGGYYDRTLAALESTPFIVGAGYELSGIDTIYPTPRDVAMHAIVTEAGVWRTGAHHKRPADLTTTVTPQQQQTVQPRIYS